jgi:hypothetical protein
MLERDQARRTRDCAGGDVLRDERVDQERPGVFAFSRISSIVPT